VELAFVDPRNLEVTGEVPGIDEGTFRSAAENAKESCPVSSALTGNVALTVTARLAGS
jgi:osmotically inducible protein OsmC